MIFSEKDREQIVAHGLTLQQVEEQAENFLNGFKPVKLVKPATIKDGIHRFSKQETDIFVSLYRQCKDGLKTMKFVPASGAATRMMKDLYGFVSSYKDEKTTPLSSFPLVCRVMENLESFAFYDRLQEVMKDNGLCLEQCRKEKKYVLIGRYILEKQGLNYGKSPKALILFHKKGDRVLTSFEEHLIEANEYCRCKDKAKIEFSITEDHQADFDRLKKEVIPYYERLFGVKYEIDFSYQQHSTDTVAVDCDNRLVHDKDGNLLFRPAGHGALIENIDKLESDIIFIKNIDNVSSTYRAQTSYCKQFLAGVLLYVRDNIYRLQDELSKSEKVERDWTEIYRQIEQRTFISGLKRPEQIGQGEDYRAYLLKFFDRPLRVCGMVANQGEPGGGPYFVEKNGTLSLQIVEKAQMDLSDKEQDAVFKQSTHFNPVDLLVCPLRKDGTKFDLTRYIDKETGFISEKSFEGKAIKAQERPGLWNGAMSDWLTVFVEVPIETFTPVKTLADLIRPEHCVKTQR